MMKSVLFVALLVALASQSYAISGEDTVVPETTIREDHLEKNPSSSLEDRLGSQVTSVDPPVTLLLEDALEGASEETTEVQERFLRLKKVGKRINKDMKKLGKDVKKFGKAASKKTQKVLKKVLKHVKKTEKKVTDFFTKPWFKWTDQALETTEVQESANNGQQEGFVFFKKAWKSVERSVKKEEKKITKIAIPAVTQKSKHNHVFLSKAVEKVKNDLIKINIDMKKVGLDLSTHFDLSKHWHHVKVHHVKVRKL